MTTKTISLEQDDQFGLVVLINRGQTHRFVTPKGDGLTFDQLLNQTHNKNKIKITFTTDETP